MPSFCIALFMLRLWKEPHAIAAMCCAVATFVLLYALLASIDTPLAKEDHLLARAMRVGTSIRGWISGLSLMPILTGTVWITPDAWCGFAALLLQQQAAGILQISQRPDLDNPGAGGFWWIYSATMLEGFILSIFLFTFAFFALIFLQARARKTAFRNPGLEHEGGI